MSPPGPSRIASDGSARSYASVVSTSTAGLRPSRHLPARPTVLTTSVSAPPRSHDVPTEPAEDWFKEVAAASEDKLEDWAVCLTSFIEVVGRRGTEKPRLNLKDSITWLTHDGASMCRQVFGMSSEAFERIARRLQAARYEVMHTEKAFQRMPGTYQPCHLPPKAIEAFYWWIPQLEIISPPASPASTQPEEDKSSISTAKR